MFYYTLDNCRQYSFRDERLARARELGYRYISEAAIKTYMQVKSIRRTAKIMSTPDNPVGYSAVLHDLMRCGIKRGPRGGANNKRKHRELI